MPSSFGRTGRRALLAWVTALAACGGPDLPPVPPADPARYRLGPGDEVRVITYGEAQLTGTFRVDASGNVSLPLIGGVRAQGLTPDELAKSIAEALRKANLYRNPSVSVEVATYRPVFVLGEVTKPGQYPYQPGMTVVTAVAVAGGFTYRAVSDRFSIVRTTQTGPVEGRARRNTPVQPGDVITVFERLF
jgi:polysaccharide export outer membrane protein